MKEKINHSHYGGIKFLLLLIYISFFYSINYAALPKRIRNAFVYCHHNKETGIDSLINMNGYYRISCIDTAIVSNRKLFDSGAECISMTSCNPFMFYPNGLFKMNLPVKYDSIYNQFDISLGLQEIVENIKGNENKWFYYGLWGSYILCNDTIKIQYIDKPWPLSSTYGREEWFKIINRDSLIHINSMPLSTDKSDWKNYENYKAIKNKKYQCIAVFVPVVKKPTPENAWILKEKWFWCNEQDWKDYMEKIKKK